MGARNLVEWLSEIEDPRNGPALQHNLVELLVVAICAVLSGAESCADMELWGKHKLTWLRGFLKLSNGIPSHDTFSRVFRLLDPKKFEAVFRSWVGGVIGALSGTVAIDGKTVRGSHDGETSAIHMVSAFATELGLVVGQEKVADKSNEITAIPELLKALHLKGCLVSIDAMGVSKGDRTHHTRTGGGLPVGGQGQPGQSGRIAASLLRCGAVHPVKDSGDVSGND